MNWQEMKEQAEVLFKSRLFPVQSVEQALSLMLIGKDLGIEPTLALRSIQVIQGKPTIPPELMLGLCIQKIPGFTYEFGACDNRSATIIASRPGLKSPFVSPFTIQDAICAGLVKDGSSWKKYPANMLRWRAIANCLHVVAPDVLVGVYTPEEMDEDVNPNDSVANDAELESQPEPQAEPEAEPDVPICADCKQPIQAGTVNGDAMSVPQIVQLTTEAFKRPLCINCADNAVDPFQEE